MASYSGTPVIGGAQWNGNQALATRKQLLSSVAGLYTDLQDLSGFTFQNIDVSTLTAQKWISTPQLFASTIQSLNYVSTPQLFASTLQATTYVSTAILYVSTIDGLGDITGGNLIGISTGDISLISISSMKFNAFDVSGSFSPKFSLDLGLGSFFGSLAGNLGGLLAGTIGAVTGGVGITTGLAGLVTARQAKNIRPGVFETINGTAQLQFSTLGHDYPYWSSIFRLVSTTGVLNTGVETFVSTIFPGGTKCVRTVSDPLYLPSMDQASSIQGFSEWVPLQTELFDTISSIRTQTNQLLGSNITITSPSQSTPALTIEATEIKSFTYADAPNLPDFLNGFTQQLQPTTVSYNFFSTNFTFNNPGDSGGVFWNSTFTFQSSVTLSSVTNMLLQPVGVSSFVVNARSNGLPSSLLYIDTRQALSSLHFVLDPVNTIVIPPGSTKTISFTAQSTPLVGINGFLNDGQIIPNFTFFGSDWYSGGFDPYIIYDAGPSPRYFVDYTGFIYSYPDSNAIYQYSQFALNGTANVGGLVAVYDLNGDPWVGSPSNFTVQAQSGGISTIGGLNYYLFSNIQVSSFTPPTVLPSTLLSVSSINVYGQLTSPIETLLTGFNIVTDVSTQTVSDGNLSMKFSTITIGNQYTGSADKPITMVQETRLTSNAYFYNSPNPYPYDYATYYKQILLGDSNNNFLVSSNYSYTLDRSRTGGDWFIGNLNLVDQYVSTNGIFPPMKIQMNASVPALSNWLLCGSNNLMARTTLYNYDFTSSFKMRQYTTVVSPVAISEDPTNTSNTILDFTATLYASTASEYSVLPQFEMAVGWYFYGGACSGPNTPVSFNANTIGSGNIDMSITNLGYQLPPPPNARPTVLPVSPSTIASPYYWYVPGSLQVNAKNEITEWFNWGTYADSNVPYAFNPPYPFLANQFSLFGSNTAYAPPGSEMILWQTTPNSTDKTLFIVARVESELSDNYPEIPIITGDPTTIPGTMGWYFRYDSSTSNYLYGLVNQGVQVQVEGIIPNPKSGFHAYALRSQAGSNKVWVDGLPVALQTDNAPAAYTGSIANLVMNLFNNGTSATFVEVLAFEQGLTDNEVGDINYYLKYSYGL